MNKNIDSIKKQTINATEYRKSRYYKRNQEIWKCRFGEKLSYQKISLRFHLSVTEVKEIIALHKQFYQQEYD